jgi:uncharacterized SAM-binding protein YcdF (DUF218 family)
VTPLIDFVFSGAGAVVVLALAVIPPGVRSTRTRVARVLAFVAVAYLLISIYDTSHTAGRLLVHGYRPFRADEAAAGRTAVVVLGSSSVTARDWDNREFSVSDRAGEARVVEAFRVFTLINPAWIISSGGLTDASERMAPSGATMRDALVQLGVPAERILVETASGTTRDEAVIVAPMLRALHPDRVVLVTSDIHMRRSLGAFRAAGVDAIPAIARDPDVPGTWAERVLPSDRGLREAGAVAHEYLGIVFYVARGWYRF